MDSSLTPIGSTLDRSDAVERAAGPLSRPSVVPIAIVVLLCLGINLALFVGIAVRRPEYLRDSRLCRNPDAHHYVLLGRNLLLHGHFSRSERSPYVPDMLRTPISSFLCAGQQYVI